MPESQLKSQATSAIQKLGQALSSLKSALSSEGSADKREELEKLLRKVETEMRRSQIEMDLAGCSDKQATTVQAFFDSIALPLNDRPYKEFAVVGGNRSGKTVTGRIVVAKWIRDIAKAGDVVWCIAPEDSVSIRGQQKELWHALPRWMFGDAVYDERNGFGGRSNTVIIDPTGRRIVVRFKTEAQYKNNPRSFEQEKVALIWCDESLSDEAFKALRPRTIDLGSPILLTCIPDQAWIFDEFENAKPGSRRFFMKMGMKDNHHLPPSEIADAEKNWTDDEKQMRLYGNFRFLSGLVYKEFVKEYAPTGHLCRPFTIPDNWPRMRSLDWGNAHPTVCLWFAVAPNETLYVYREYVATYKSIEQHSKAIKAMSGDEKYSKKLVIDSTCYNRNQATAGSIASEFERFGIPCMPAPRVNVVGEWALIQKVKARLEAKTYIGPMLQVFDTCEHLIWEFRRWKVKTDKVGQPLASDSFEDKANDALDCVKYGVAVNSGMMSMKVTRGIEE